MERVIDSHGAAKEQRRGVTPRDVGPKPDLVVDEQPWIRAGDVGARRCGGHVCLNTQGCAAGQPPLATHDEVLVTNLNGRLAWNRA